MERNLIVAHIYDSYILNLITFKSLDNNLRLNYHFKPTFETDKSSNPNLDSLVWCSQSCSFAMNKFSILLQDTIIVFKFNNYFAIFFLCKKDDFIGCSL